MSIDWKDDTYNDNIDKWRRIDAVCDGEEVDEYLIPLNEHDKSPDNMTRNKQYRERAVFYQIAGRTLAGLVGLVYAKKPQLDLSNELAHLEFSADGKGTGIIEQSQDVVEDLIKFARGGLFVTYPQVQGELSKADIATGKYFPTIHEYDAESIINVDYMNVGAMVKLSLVVLAETVTVRDGYKRNKIDQRRELAIEDGVFVQRLWRKAKDAQGNEEWIVFEESIPRKSNGSTWDVLPFFLFDRDQSLIKPLVELNIAHYRDSADFQENAWYAGQSQWWISGLRQDDSDKMKEQGIYIGSRQVIGVPSGEKLGCETPPANPLVRQSMIDKLDAMIGLGASYIMPNNSTKTATEANLDAGVTSNALSLIVHNVNIGYKQCLQWCAEYAGGKGEFTINTDFIKTNATPQDIQVMVQSWLQGAIPTADYLAYMKEVEKIRADMTVEQFNDELPSADMPDLGAM